MCLLAACSGPDATAERWIVEFDGVGRIRIGMHTSEAVEQLGGTVRIDRVEPDEACGQAYFSAAPAGLSFMVEGDTIVRIDVDSAGILTQDGAGVGQEEATLLTRFARRIIIEPHAYTGPEGHYLILDPLEPSAYRMIFETDGRVVTGFRSGRRPEVEQIEVCL